MKDTTRSVDTSQVEVDVARLAEELESLLRQNVAVPTSADSADSSTMRVSVANLIFVVSDSRLVKTVTPTLAEIASRHPSRIIVIDASDKGESQKPRAWLRPYCHRLSSNRTICSEEITLEIGPAFVQQAHFLTQPLLASDVPTYLWWRAAAEFDNPLFTDLARLSTRLVLHSSEFPSAPQNLQSLWRLIQDPTFLPAANDIGWTRLASWRELVAQFFDVSEYCDLLPRISRVAIQYETPRTEAVPARPLLMIGWLASRLGWQPASPLHQVEKGRHYVILKSRETTVGVELNSVERHVAKPGGVLSVELICSEPEALICVSRRSDVSGLADAYVELSGHVEVRRTLPLEIPDEVELMLRQFSIVGRDRTFEATVEMVARIAGG